jgi:hypothetical protein
MEHPVPELHGELDIATQKARPSAKAGLAICDLRLSLVLTNQNQAFIFCLTRFLGANRYPLRSKTLRVSRGYAIGS